MLGSGITNIFGRFSKNSYKAIKTFTYFIPAPPQRKAGYREKEYDQIFYNLLQKDFELLDFKNESVENGMWIICVLGATTEESAKFNLDIHHDLGLSEDHQDGDIIIEQPQEHEQTILKDL